MTNIQVSLIVQVEGQDQESSHARTIKTSHHDSELYNALNVEATIAKAAEHVLTQVTTLYGDIRDNHCAPESVREQSRVITQSGHLSRSRHD